MVGSSYIIIVSGMGDDVPILGALVTLLKADGLLLFLMMLLYISIVRSSYIIIVSGKEDDMPILGALVTLLEAMVICSIWSSGDLVIWSSFQYHHLVDTTTWYRSYYTIVPLTPKRKS